jgi:hypothetical protein
MVGNRAGHGPPFRRLALALGLRGAPAPSSWRRLSSRAQPSVLIRAICSSRSGNLAARWSVTQPSSREQPARSGRIGACPAGRLDGRSCRRSAGLGCGNLPAAGPASPLRAGRGDPASGKCGASAWIRGIGSCAIGWLILAGACSTTWRHRYDPRSCAATTRLPGPGHGLGAELPNGPASLDPLPRRDRPIATRGRIRGRSGGAASPRDTSEMSQAAQSSLERRLNCTSHGSRVFQLGTVGDTHAIAHTQRGALGLAVGLQPATPKPTPATARGSGGRGPVGEDPETGQRVLEVARQRAGADRAWVGRGGAGIHCGVKWCQGKPAGREWLLPQLPPPGRPDGGRRNASGHLFEGLGRRSALDRRWTPGHPRPTKH